MKHTPTPWELHQGEDYIVILRGDETTDQGIMVDNLVDAAFIVQACNSHDDLLAAAELLLQQYDSSGDFTMGGNLTNEPFLMFRAALARAKGEA